MAFKSEYVDYLKEYITKVLHIVRQQGRMSMVRNEKCWVRVFVLFKRKSWNVDNITEFNVVGNFSWGFLK